MMRRASAGAALLLVLALAGCATIPTDGAVHAAATDAPNPQTLVFIPPKPALNATPEEIVRGFVGAASEGKQYHVAREYLTADSSRRWRPKLGVLVHEASWTTSGAAPAPGASTATISLSVPVSARIDAAGAYTPSSGTTRLPFRLVKQKGQWRISKAPNGIVLASSVLQSTFRQEVLQFWDPSFTQLVPDLRWFPRQDSEVATIVAAVLAGASAPLRGNVTASAFPVGTRLVSAAGSDTEATVALEVPGPQPSAVALRRMWLEISRSLPLQVNQVDLSVNGRTVQGAPPQPRSIQPSPQPIVFANGQFGALTSTGVTPDAVLGPRISTLRPTAVTVSNQQGFAAVLSSRGVFRVTRPASKLIDSRSGLAEPTLDQRGWIYSVQRDDPSSLIAVSAAGRRVSLDGLTGSQVVALEASPDGARMLVLVTNANGLPQAFVAGIERAADGTPVGLSPARYPVQVNAGAAADATWVDNGSVAVLTQQSDGQTVTVTVLGSVTTSLGRLAKATELVGATGLEDLRARLDSGDVYARSNAIWQSVFPTAVDVRLLAVQR